jgi:integrase/recombinase XerD
MPAGDRKGPRLQAVPGDPDDRGGFVLTVAGFEVWMGVHGYTAATIESRRRAIVFFVVWLAERNIMRPVDVSLSMLERYQRYLFHYRKPNGQPLTLRTQVQRLTPIRAFFKWATRQHITAINPASELELPRTEQRLPKPALTVSEAEAVLAVPDLSTHTGLRDRAMLEVLYSTGMRRAELAGLHLHDVDVERRTVLIRQGKGRKDRMIPIGQRALDWIERYNNTVRVLWAPSPDTGTLFLTVDGTSVSLHRLTSLMKSYVTASGVAKEGSCHLFRHTTATLMLEGGADIRFVQQMLGHADIKTTQIYAQVTIHHLQAIHTATHPAASLVPRSLRSERSGDISGGLVSSSALLKEEDQLKNRTDTR